jgi:benzoyl-CoA reductase/2-hydroxyglutaryl-CoA dehydratase subunit BcrC/BadD/HgdB
MSKVIAVADSLIPEEILHAAGLSTVRLSALGDMGGEGHFPSQSCAYCRSTERIATRRPSPIDGAVFANGCTSMQKLFEVFARKSGLEPVVLLDTPKIDGARATQFYAQRLEQFGNALAALAGSAVEDAALAEAIRLNNAFRAGLRRCRRYRSSELADGALSLASLPERTRKLSQAQVAERGDAPRLLIAGTHLREEAWRAAIEAEGGCASYFLTEDGDSYNQIDVVPTDDHDLYGALARAYLASARAGFGRLPAISTDPASLAALLREHGIRGVVLTHYAFCAKGGYEGAWLSGRLGLSQTPVLRLELDRPEAIDARVRTRIAAFVEMLRR